MDRPLLALTRAPSQTPGGQGLSEAGAAGENMRQLVQLRWIAVAGQLITILVVHFGLGAPLPLIPMFAVLVGLALANLGAVYFLERHTVANLEIAAALLFDIGALTAQLYFSGGAANPFISLFLLQVVLGAILLRGSLVWLVVGFAIGCYVLLTVASVPLVYPQRLSSEMFDLYKVGSCISFVLMGVLLTLFITRIARNLVARDTHVADMRRRAAEEDGIVRMGLFASSAAHELGTPLASLSVILNDWRREPAVAGDPALAEDLTTMEAEVLRCKTIVTDILESAGEPRGEAMSSVGAHAFLDEVTDAWRPAHPKTAFEVRYDGPEDVVIAASPSLRQAIVNLLDNAAEASPGRVSMQVTLSDEGLVVAVLDEGPGFAPGRLADVGKRYRSTKGPGHGVGLFLAANVARKHGGRLEATNRPSGGAEVRLVLPLAAYQQEKG